jgi:hypothetical protein
MERPPTASSTLFIPIKENCRIAFAGVLMLYFPSTSVFVPFVVPFTTIFTPAIGAPSLSVTLPETVIVCAIEGIQHTHSNPSRSMRAFLLKIFRKYFIALDLRVETLVYYMEFGA